MRLSRVLVILNPASGQHDAAESRAALEAVLRERGISYEVRQTEAENDALEWAKNANPAHYDAVIAAGGDGTIVEAMNGLLAAQSTLPLLPIPLGTANGLARALKLPLTVKGALEAALDGGSTALDVAHVVNRGHHFLLFAGAGYDATVIREADREQKDKYGFMAYIYAALRQLKKQRNQRLTLTLDGKQFNVVAHSILLFNASAFEIAGIPVGPKADARDGKLDIVLLRDPTVWGILRELLYLLTHRLKVRPPEFLRASSLNIKAQRPLMFQTDGDALGETPVDIKIKAGAARFIVPLAFLEREKDEATAHDVAAPHQARSQQVASRASSFGDK
jgi:diacylglycerol kinase (ATP)